VGVNSHARAAELASKGKTKEIILLSFPLKKLSL